MSVFLNRTLKTASCALAVLAGSHAWAADPVTDAMQAAYAPYRVALFKTNSNSQADSQQALTQAQQAWNKVMAQFGSKPTPPYDRDTAFAASLAEVAKVYAKASEEVAANKLTDAHNTLEHAREVMADMRHRNQISVYSDHMNAYHAEMEHVLIDGSNTLAQPNGMLQLTATVGALHYLANKLGTEAPANYATNEEFKGLLKTVQKSVTDLQAALFTQDTTAVKDAMTKIKAPYSKFFIKFG